MENLFTSPYILAEKIFQKQNQNDLELQKYSEKQRQTSIRDIVFNLDYLNQSLQMQSPSLFWDYIQWLHVVLVQRGVSSSIFRRHLEVLADVVQTEVPDVFAGTNASFFENTFDRWQEIEAMLNFSFLDPSAILGSEAAKYLDLVMKMERHAAVMMVKNLITEGYSVKDIYLHLIQPVQQEIGRLWQMNQISVAQEHYATAVSQLVMSQLYPHIFSTERTGYRMVAACVGNELHEIGIRMVSDFFEIAGWDTYYLGANTPTESIIQSINQKQADVVALSVTMSSQILKTQSLIENIRQGSDPRVKVLVGGHPFNVEPMAWQRVGADGYAANAEQAIETAFSLLDSD